MPRSAGTSTKDELVDAFKDATVAEVIAKALAPYIARAVEAAIAALQTKVDALGAEVGAVKADNQRLRAQIQEQGGRLEEMEIYSRAHDLIIRGLPESTYSERATASADGTDVMPSESHTSVAASILKLCNETLEVPVELREISVAHRLKAGKNDSHRPIIVRFTSRKTRDDVLRAKKKLFTPRGSSSASASASTTRVYICEHLTKNVSTIFFEARKLVKEKKLAAAWTHKGLVNIKYTLDTQEKPTVVRNLAELGQRRP